MTPPRRVALFGGSFNPPHICHLLASIYVLQTCSIDSVWWLPVHRHAFAKDRQLAPWEQRLALCRAVAAEWDGIEVDTIEAELEPPSYTVDTVAALRARHPDIAFSWVIGSDLLAELDRWSRWEQLRQEVEFIVLGRGSATDHDELPAEGRFLVRDFSLPDVSSSAVRAGLRAGSDVRAWLPQPVAAWLDAHPELYR